MGVPKFFRYISERYPCLSELIRENQVPEFDNLYLDMNGIIHNCSHPNDSDVFFRITEEQIFSDIFHYLEFLFRMIRPQKLFFIAVDGVAPRAKMNQQRGRRFRSAREAQEQAELAEQKGDVLPTEARFDSNCITPGTSFMVRLQRAMEHFIKVKVSTNPLWKHCNVILSGHETPGEGEHKIMEYIRHAKASPNFDPNTRHCLYGLDADLVVLGLCTHERHFSLLREEVKFGKNDKKSTIVEETHFYLLHLTLMREYLELEFAPVRDKLKIEFNIYKLIDDWVLMGYMVGNDFIPHLPHLHINENALPTLFQAYMDVLPTLDGYINEGGILNLSRLEVLMNRLARFDRDIFLEHYTDLKYFKEKRGPDNMDAFDVTIDEIKAEVDMDLSALIKASEDMFMDDDDEDERSDGDIEGDPEFFEKEFALYQRNYYITKMGYQDFTEETRAEQAECYIRALQWTLLYYYRGVPSWGWYYPHHYAPFISDVQQFKHLRMDFELGKPFLPFQQLLSVLPAASKDHLPSAYHKLMTDPSSPVIDFYPEKFSTDLNGKQQSWEAVVLIPFIEERRLLKAMEQCDTFLTDEEKQRNIHGPMELFQYDEMGTAFLAAQYGFDDIDELKAKVIHVYREDLRVDEDKLVLGPSKGAIVEGYIKGFPTMKHLQYHGIIKEARVKVFNFPSRSQSMVVVIDRPLSNVKSTETLVQELLGRIVYVSWPHLTEAKVVKVVDAKLVYDKDAEPRPNNDRFFSTCVKAIVEHHNNRLAIDLGEINQLVHVRTCVGSEYVLKDDRYVLNKLWNFGETMYPVQAIVTDLRESLKTLKPYQEIQEMFPVDSLVFLRATQWYGSLGCIVELTAGHKRIKTRFEIHEEPNLDTIMEVNEEAKSHYMGMQDAASAIGISANLLSRLSSTILMMTGGRRSLNVDERGKLNIGLQLRLVSHNEETVGYTKKVNKSWMFSEKAIELIKAYYEKVPKLFEKLEVYGKCDILFEDEMFGENKEGEIGLKELVAWIKSQDHTKAEKRPCATKMLEPAAVERLVTIVNETRKNPPLMQTMFVHPKDLYKPGMKKARSIDHQANYELLDRVVIARETEVVPLGYRGTIVAIHFAKDPNPVRQESISKEDKYFDILFDKEFPNGISMFGIEATKNRVIRVAEGAILNISYGTADFEYKLVDPQQPVILPAEEFLAGGKAHPNTRRQQSHEYVRLFPAKPCPTAESIKKRLNERIEKKNPTKAFVIANQKPREDSTMPEPNSQSCDFERLWNKLRESSQSTSAFDERDIKSFLATKTVVQQQLKISAVPPVLKPTDSNHASDSASEDPTDMLKKMLKISSADKSNAKSWRSGTNGTSRVIDDTAVKMHTNSTAPQPAIVPMPKNLPQPPSSWRSTPSKPSGDGQHSKRQQINNANPVALFNADAVKTQQRSATQQQNHHAMTQPQTVAAAQQPFPQFQPFPAAAQNRLFPVGPPPPFVPQYQPMPRYQQHAPTIPVHPPPPQQPQQQQQQLYRPQHFGGNGPNHRQRGPNGPQNLSFNRNTPAGTGAFVPLQAMINAKNRIGANPNASKKVNNQHQQPHQQSSGSTASVTAFVQKNAELRQIVEQKQEEVKQGFASFLTENKAAESVICDQQQPPKEEKCDTSEIFKGESTPKLNSDAPPPKVRQMRIAAKFSQAD